MPDLRPVTFTARYVFPVDRPPIEGGAVTIAGDRILAVGRRENRADDVDLGDVAILPGLVNAHTHLEFSNLRSPLGAQGMPLPQWIRKVIAFRASPEYDPGLSIQQGLVESAAAGVTALGEIVTSGWTREVEPQADVLLFRELIGLAEERFGKCLDDAREHLSIVRPDELAAGVSPHAPYSVHPELLGDLVELAGRYEAPLAMHLAESREELEFLKTGGGSFRAFLEEIGAWREGVFRFPIEPIEYLHTLAKGPRALVVHGNYLGSAEWEFLADNRDRMSVVYCPRTHGYFGHEPYPLAELLARGVSVALGTDSRASNPDLSILAEMRQVAAHCPAVSAQQILSLATAGGAKALGREHGQGTLTAGKLANLCVVGLPEAGNYDPHKLLLEGDGRVLRTCWRGQWVFP